MHVHVWYVYNYTPTVCTCMLLIAMIVGRRGRKITEIEEQSKASIKVC